MVRSTSEDVFENSSRRAAESDFHVKLGPWPAFPASPAETGLPPPTSGNGMDSGKIMIPLAHG
jgi:hypothetical protein